jgi:hypothetical protein
MSYRGLVVLALVIVSACGGSVSGPTTPGNEPTPDAPMPLATLPRQIFGAFAESADTPSVAANGGNVVLIVPTYDDDANVVASALFANGKVAIVSAHHVFGNPRDTWGVEIGQKSQRPGSQFKMRGVVASSVGGWQATLAWMEPLRRAGVLAGVYVVDEPLHNGIPRELRDEAITIVRNAGFRTVLFEGIDRVGNERPAVDYFGVSCYDWAGIGGKKLSQCVTAYTDHPTWNLVLGQGYDLRAVSRNGSVETQIETWAKLGRLPGRSGTIFWVWSWPGQTGLAEDGEALAAFNRASGR